jgi:MerR family mercuric resistance operon transcriptional regulator
MRFIQQAKALGFTLNEIRDLLTLRVSPKTTCAQVREQAEKKIADIENRMTQLARIKQVLIDLANGCSGRGPITECPILDALENKEL